MEPIVLRNEELLNRARRDNRSAVDELVRRFVHLVYGSALRQTRDPHQAADVTQAVFVIFIRRLRSIRHAQALPGWFFKTTQLVVRESRRQATRRRFHEKQAARSEQTMDVTNETIDPNLNLIDLAIASLGTRDRDLILRRYIQQQDFAVIAMEIGISEPSVRKRVSRAIERMRRFFSKRGALLSNSGVAGILMAAASQRASVAVVQASVAATVNAGASASISSLAAMVCKAMVWWKIKVAIAMTGILAFAGVAIAVVQMQSAHSDATAPQQMTFEEANAEMKLTYALTNDEVIRMIKPPFSQARAVWVDTKIPYARGSDRVRSLGFRWPPINGQMQDQFMSYVDQSLDDIATIGMRMKWFQFQGLDRVNWPASHADFVVRVDASDDDKTNGLARLISTETGSEVHFVKKPFERPCIILKNYPTGQGVRSKDGFDMLVVTQEQLDDQKLAGWVKGPRPADSTHAFDFERTSELLDAPFLTVSGEKEVDLPSSLFCIAADAKLHHTDADYEKKLRKVLDNIQQQIGGELAIESRAIDTYVLETTKPGPSGPGRTTQP